MLSGSRAVSEEAPRPLHHWAAPGGPPPRSGEDRGRAQHRTLGASESNVGKARKLRKEMSLPEVLLWRLLRGKPMGLKFRRQFPVLGFVADFACTEVRLLIEIDGIAHDMGDRPERDEKRDALLMHKEWRIVRIPAADMLKDAGECAASIVALAESYRPPRPCGPPPRSGEVRRKST